MYQYIIFDMDGTLADSKTGVFSSVRHALKKMNLKDPGDDVLEDFMGPPLPESFRKWFSLDDEAIEKAVVFYREYYEDKGMMECSLYPGIAALLSDLKEAGIRIAIASSKPETYVKKILEEFGIAEYFDVVSGATLDESKSSKEMVLQEACDRLRQMDGHKCRPSNTLMVGDRKFDILAAKKFSLASAAVTYGYGPASELEECSPDHIADTPADIYALATGIKPYMRHASKPAISKTITILTPLLIYWIIELAVYNLSLTAVQRFLRPGADRLADIKVLLNAVAAASVWPYLSYCMVRDCPADISDMVTKRKRRLLKKDWPLILAYSLALSFGLNIVLSFMGIVNSSRSYQETASFQYAASFPIGIVVYGILIPFTEELLFRGVIQNRLARFFPNILVIPLCALLFGCYHGNPVQMIYAFLMGLALATVYSYYGHLAAPVLMHMSANLLIYSLTRVTPLAASAPALFVAVVLLLAAAMVSAYYGGRMIRKTKLMNPDIKNH